MFSNPRKLLNTKKAAPKLNLFMLQINWTQEFLEIGSEPMWPYHCKVISFPLPARAPV